MSKEFGVKRNLAWQAQQLKKTKGILADPTPKKGRSLPQDTKEKVTAFYESNEFSRMCPGKKECVAIRDENGKKVYRQKQLLLVNLKELHVAFKEKHPKTLLAFQSSANYDQSGVFQLLLLEHILCVFVSSIRMPSL